MMTLLFQRMLKVALEDEQFFEIEVIGQDETDNASSKVVVPKRQKKANTMIGDISKGKYSSHSTLTCWHYSCCPKYLKVGFLTLILLGKS
jgi:hypothetical protein